jgi:outer membrane receptor protein involved in Fe transport
VDRNHLIRGGIDYFAGEKTTLGISGVYRTSREKADEVTVNRTYSDVSDFYQLFNQVNDTREQGKNLDLNLDYKKTFATPGQALTGSVRYSFDSDDDTDLLTSQFTGIDNLLTDQPDNLRYNFEDVNNQVLTSQLDYVMPLPKERKVEAGYKSIVRNIDNDFLFQNYSYASGAFEDVPELSNRFVFREQVHSLYSSFSGTVKNFGYQAGLRAEQTLSRSDQRTTDQKFRNDYLNFFPSVFLSYQLKDEQQLQLNYSRRINRPGLRELNPFINYSDTLNLRQGNPRLNPELTDAMEVSYQRNLKGLYITTSLFYRVTNNVIQRIIEVNANNISTTTFQNIDNRNSMGVELIARGSLTPWWNITSSFNLFRSAISGRSIQANYTNKNISWTLSLLSNMNIPKVMQVQVAANYSGPNVTPQGIRRAIYGINVGLRKDILKDRGSVSLNITDILDTREFRLQTNVPNEFTQTSNNKRESRIATLTFTWRFGKLLDSERNNRQGRENGPDSSGSDEDSF